MTLPQDTDMRIQRELEGLFPASEPSSQLRDRIAALAAQHKPSKSASRPLPPWRWRLAAALAVVLLAATVFQAARPPRVAAAILVLMDGAMHDARSAHSVMNTLMPGGTWAKTGEMWYQNGLWRTERVGVEHDVQIYRNGRLWVYEPDINTVTVDTQPGPAAFNSDGFSLSALLGSGAFGTPPPQVHPLGDTVFQGRPAQEVAVVTPMHEKMLFWVDPATHLPFHLEAQHIVSGAWQTGVEGDITYNQALPASLFSLDFPRTAKVFDKDLGVEALHRQWTQGIAHGQAGGRRIVIRDVEINPHNDIFILYTAGHKPDDDPSDLSIDVKDDAGHDYRRGGWGRSFNPIFRDPKPTFMFGSDALEGFCQAPAQGTVTNRARRLTVTFQCQSVPPRDGKSHRLYFLGKPATLTVPITRRISTDFPAYMPYMAMPMEEEELKEMNNHS